MLVFTVSVNSSGVVTLDQIRSIVHPTSDPDESKTLSAANLVAWAETDFSSDVQGNKTPLLVLLGEHDPALGLPVMQATFQQQYPNCTIHVLSNAGHYAMFETPVALATTVESFLRD